MNSEIYEPSLFTTSLLVTGNVRDPANFKNEAAFTVLLHTELCPLKKNPYYDKMNSYVVQFTLKLSNYIFQLHYHIAMG